jgi:hypothetical protein
MSSLSSSSAISSSSSGDDDDGRVAWLEAELEAIVSTLQRPSLQLPEYADPLTRFRLFVGEPDMVIDLLESHPATAQITYVAHRHAADVRRFVQRHVTHAFLNKAFGDVAVVNMQAFENLAVNDPRLCAPLLDLIMRAQHNPHSHPQHAEALRGLTERRMLERRQILAANFVLSDLAAGNRLSQTLRDARDVVDIVRESGTAEVKLNLIGHRAFAEVPSAFAHARMDPDARLGLWGFCEATTAEGTVLRAPTYAMVLVVLLDVIEVGLAARDRDYATRYLAARDLVLFTMPTRDDEDTVRDARRDLSAFDWSREECADFVAILCSDDRHRAARFIGPVLSAALARGTRE